jgi:hypothetical protein
MGVKLGLSLRGKNIDGMLRRVFGPKRSELKGDWRRLHYEEIYDLYSSPNIMRLIK